MLTAVRLTLNNKYIALFLSDVLSQSSNVFDDMIIFDMVLISFVSLIKHCIYIDNYFVLINFKISILQI